MVTTADSVATVSAVMIEQGGGGVRQQLSELIDNIRQGTRLARFRPIDPSRLTLSVDQLVLLVLLDLLLEIGSDWFSNQPNPDFSSWGLSYSSFTLMFLLLGAFLATRLTRSPAMLLPMLVLFFAASPLLYLVDLFMAMTLSYVGSETAIYYSIGIGILMLWMLLIPLRAFWVLNGKRLGRAVAAAAILYAVVLPVVFFIGDDSGYWYAEDNAPDPYAAYEALDAESLLFSQQSRLDAQLARLFPQRDRVADIYFVSFASDAHQEVFRREVGYVQRLMAERFDTAGRSVSLINHLKGYPQQPFATGTNLAYTLKRIGEVINPEEDIVILYLTSHGSDKHELSVAFGDLPLNNLTPIGLRAMLDAAGIKWRVVLVSACYSGGYVEPLSDDYTLVATASAKDRQSFGCSNENDFTYFGEALFKGQLTQEHSLVTAIEQAQAAISLREQQEKLEPSKPQLRVGRFMERKLEGLARELDMVSCLAAAAARGEEPLEQC